MKHLLFILSTFFAFYGFACLNASETTLNNEIVNQLSTDAGLNFQSDDHQPEQVNEEEGISNGAEKPKKKKVIKGLIYYLGGGFVLLVIGMVFFIRKKPKMP